MPFFYAFICKKLCFYLQSYNKTPVLQGISFYVPERTITALVGLSGGEKQRIFITRALIKDAPIVLLDELIDELGLYKKLWNMQYQNEKY